MDTAALIAQIRSDLAGNANFQSATGGSTDRLFLDHPAGSGVEISASKPAYVVMAVAFGARSAQAANLAQEGDIHLGFSVFGRTKLVCIQIKDIIAAQFVASVTTVSGGAGALDAFEGTGNFIPEPDRGVQHLAIDYRFANVFA